jgi:gamma-glutamylcyclotransferase (GGCT)/AIG2-like uncharacterized protein YtfP
MSMGVNTLLFVYGTLKRGEENHRWLSTHHPRFLGEARIQGRLFRIKGQSYPGAAPTRSRRYVRGELYELTRPDEALKKLDKFEGTDEGLFVRRLAEVWIGGQKKKAWTYFYPGRKDKAGAIAEGKFAMRPASRPGSSIRKRTAKRGRDLKFKI